MSVFEAQLQKMSTQAGFIAALDQSGGSTPTALAMYGVEPTEYNGEEEMYNKVHQMRTRVMTNSEFTGDKILGAILFENTLRKEVEGKATAKYLWEEKQIIPFLKIDKGLAERKDGIQMMKDFGDFLPLLAEAKAQGVFGTKMRSAIHEATEEGVEKIVAQQFDYGKQIIAAGLVPIIEPEVDINSKEKEAAEALLAVALLKHANLLAPEEKIMLKLTLPEQANLYADLIAHPNVIRVVALSGGYSSEEANKRLTANNGMIASFSRALSEKIFAHQSDEEFTKILGESIDTICAASAT